jgi:endonuclease/exonuclease/phosphatase family metal-dependent hydrolase
MQLVPSQGESGPCRILSSAEATALIWLQPTETSHRSKLDAACRRVGPVVVASPDWPDGPRAVPPGERPGDRLIDPEVMHAPEDVDQVVLVSWNTHLGRGDLDALLAALKSGALTGAAAPRHFVLLLQEVYRSPILAFARQHRLHVVFAPARRQDGEDEDRGSAILSTLHPQDVLVVELPYEKHRRIAVGAALRQRDASGREWTLRVVNAHFDTAVALFRGGPASARRRQARALLEALAGWPPPVVLGADLNTWWGDDEPAVRELRRALPDAESLRARETWRGPLWAGTKLDYVFAKGTPGRVRVNRLGHRYGSDHWPLVAVVPVE